MTEAIRIKYLLEINNYKLTEIYFQQSTNIEKDLKYIYKVQQIKILREHCKKFENSAVKKNVESELEKIAKTIENNSGFALSFPQCIFQGKKQIIKIFLPIVFLCFVLQQPSIANNKLTPDVLTAIAKCSECHGVTGEIKALNRSNISISTLNKEDFLTMLKGYKEGTYGGELKAFMRSRMAYLNKRQLTAIAEYYTSQNKKENK